MKKILYINQYFKHPGEPGSTRSYWIARRLIEAGYQVTMIAQRNLEHGYISEAPHFERKDVDGIEVIYLRSRYSNTMGIVRRLWAFIYFMARSSFRALIEKDVDLVIATSTPLTVAVPALLRNILRGTPYIFEVRDLWPEVPIQMGIIRNGLVISFLRWFEKTVYRRAAHIVALSPGMQDGIVRYVSKYKTSMIPNMAKIDQFWPREENRMVAEKLGLLANRFRVLYFGQMGQSNAIPYIIDAAAILNKRHPDIDFLFVGHGMMKERVRHRIEKEDLGNVRLSDRVAMKEMSEIVNLCDISLVTFANLPILYTNSPNKLFDSLSAGKPVLVNSAGWTKTMVEENDCGLYVDPGDPEALADCITQLKSDPERCKSMGRNARALAEAEYDKSILCTRFTDMVDSTFHNLKVTESKN